MGVEQLRPYAWKQERSPYAWMSRRDGELIRSILLSSATRLDRPLRVLEWGSGQSTLSFSQILTEHDVAFHWSSLEYDRAFFDAELAPELLHRPDSLLRYVDRNHTAHGPRGNGRHVVEALCWNRGELRPYLPGREAERTADLDDYVRYPTRTAQSPDVVIVDGRKRRRCLLAATAFTDALVLLHDAWHDHYHCALDAYPAALFFGDELWAGAHDPARLDTLPSEI